MDAEVRAVDLHTGVDELIGVYETAGLVGALLGWDAERATGRRPSGPDLLELTLELLDALLALLRGLLRLVDRVVDRLADVVGILRRAIELTAPGERDRRDAGENCWEPRSHELW